MRQARLGGAMVAEEALGFVRTELVMGFPVTIAVANPDGEPSSLASRTASRREIAAAVAAVYDHLREVDVRFSPYRATSEVSRINGGELREEGFSPEMKRVLRLCEETKRATRGYFDPWRGERLDPSGLVKGLAVYDASGILRDRGFEDFCIEAGGDIEARGRCSGGEKWRIGIRSPFDPRTVVKAVALENRGIATSGLYARGEHIYNPLTGRNATETASFTVIGPNLFEADRFATAAFAMGRRGLELIRNSSDLDGYMIEHDGTATYTEGFLRYVTE